MDIDKILLKTFNDQASLEEYEALESWKKESVDNLEYLNTMTQKHKQVYYKDFDKNKAWKKVNNKLGLQLSTVLKTLAVIAGILAVLAAAYYLTREKETKDIFTTKNNIQNFALLDNSQIWLNGNSELQYKSDFQQERRVNLKGEAYFEVKADADNPFIIELNDTDFIKVIGTSFNVLNDSENFDLTVYSGKVEFHALNRIIELEKNDRIVKINGGYTKIKNKDQNILSWKNKVLIFENVSLQKAFEDLEDYYNVGINVNTDVAFTNCTLRSRYSQENISDVFVELKKLFDMEYVISQDQITISRLNCN